MRLLRIAARVAVKNYAGPMLEMLEQSGDRAKAVQAFGKYVKLWYEKFKDRGALRGYRGDDAELDALFPNKILQAVAKKATGKDYDDDQFPTEASADSTIHELDHLLADPSFVLNVLGKQSDKSDADSLMDEIIISKLWGKGTDQARENIPISRSLYSLAGVEDGVTIDASGEYLEFISLERFFDELSKVHLSDPARDVIFTRAIRDVRREFASQMDESAGNEDSPHKAAIRIVEEIMKRADVRKDLVARELEEGFKRAYLMVQSMCANWTKKLQALH
jgi:hypothetical protein